jgi:hypothetical protein
LANLSGVRDTVPEDLRMVRLVFDRLGLRFSSPCFEVIPEVTHVSIGNSAGYAGNGLRHFAATRGVA